jgi:hypothetical protein
MSRGYSQLFSTYTDEQLMELVRQRDTLVGAGREALDEELRRRRHNLDEVGSPAPEASFPVDAGKLSLNIVSRFFLRAPSWQIFMMVCIVGFFASVAQVAKPWNAVNLFAFSFWTSILAAVCEICWQWSLGSFLAGATHPELRMKKTLFRLAIASSLIVLPLMFISILKPRGFFWILLIEVFLTVCNFYILYFVSKSLVLAERSKPASFYDYVGPFFMILLLPIGIWSIQPRVNRLYESTMSRLA